MKNRSTLQDQKMKYLDLKNEVFSFFVMIMDA